ncbi:uncharacterized protein LOC114170085 [Vigna unguiculata]|uniref:Uncharacterized protein n=1 Tax=Vigna unguiculata TaxID=3917 RepID=A0A4D6LIG4_VIGUN|nr:uncharacterized protein LOC114170085 [Vigna unguiculata]QCD87924.1 hypothetical protein DEO72_LG3g2464 [Vigna unguiculata]
MGNCLRKSKISAQVHEKVKVVPTMSKLEAAEMEERMKKKVRLMVKNGGSCKSGGLRIRVVMSQEELKKMLSQQQSTSMEQLLHAVKLRGGRISEVGDDCFDDDERIGSWKPSLDSIPEDSYSSV